MLAMPCNDTSKNKLLFLIGPSGKVLMGYHFIQSSFSGL
jgi:hypothetical protein